MQVLQYEAGQYYNRHHDQNSPRSSAWGPRMFTVFMYIGDGYEGGLTHFPRLNLSIKPDKGTALIFFPAFLNGELDTDALHSGMPAEDTKWVSQVWIRQTSHKNGRPSSPVRCV